MEEGQVQDVPREEPGVVEEPRAVEEAPEKTKGRKRGRKKKEAADAVAGAEEGPDNEEDEGAQRGAKLPLSRVRQILALDPELKPFRRESLVLITKATELFVGHVAAQAYRNTETAGRKQLKPEDIEKAVRDLDSLEFLRVSLDTERQTRPS